MQWQVLSWAGDTELWQLRPPHPLSPCLTHLSAPGTERQVPQGRSLTAKEPGPLAVHPPRLRAAPSLGSMGGWGTCTWPGQEGRVTHTKFDNQQRHVLAGPLLPPGCPTPRVQSLRPAPNTLLRRKRGAGSRCDGLSAPSVAASWTVGGGHGETSLGLLPPALGLQLWGVPPQAGALPWATTVLPLLGQVNNCCCF